MTQTATRTSAKATAAPAPAVHEVEVGRGGQHLLNKLANARIARLLAERTENPLKEKWKERFTLEADKVGGLKKGDVLVIKALGVVRGQVTMRSRGKSVDLDLLLQAFPEAYEACVSENESLQFDPS
jgi:hypothetical protein